MLFVFDLRLTETLKSKDSHLSLNCKTWGEDSCQKNWRLGKNLRTWSQLKNRIQVLFPEMISYYSLSRERIADCERRWTPINHLRQPKFRKASVYISKTVFRGAGGVIRTVTRGLDRGQIKASCHISAIIFFSANIKILFSFY